MQYYYEYLESVKEYDSFNKSNSIDTLKRIDSTTKFEEITESNVTYPYSVKIYRMNETSSFKTLKSPDDLESWRISLERSFAWKPIKEHTLNDWIINATASESKITLNTPVEPKHYQNYFEENEWIDIMANIPRFKDKEVFKGAIEFQIRKYLDRNGRKDPEFQELKKGLYYYLYLIKYIETNGSVKSKDIHEIMKSI